MTSSTKSAFKMLSAIDLAKGYMSWDGSSHRVLCLLEPQDEPDIIECDGILYMPDKECEFIPEEFAISYVFDEQGNAKPVGKPSDDCERFYCSECGFDMGFASGGEPAWFENSYPWNPFFSYCPNCRARVRLPWSWLNKKEVDR